MREFVLLDETNRISLRLPEVNVIIVRSPFATSAERNITGEFYCAMRCSPDIGIAQDTKRGGRNSDR